MKKLRSNAAVIITALILSMMLLAGCGGTQEASGSGLEDGTYVARFTTDNSMFHVSEANQDLGILTVENGQMTIHVSLQSKRIVNLFLGTAGDAARDGAELLEPTTDTVTYSDGYEDEVYGFDIPVPVLDEEFDVALLGTKGKWYDHKVVVSDPVPGDTLSVVLDEMEPSDSDTKLAGTAEIGITDGEYSVEVTLDGGSGRASVDSPAAVSVKNGEATATITWSSPNYDYMIVDGKRYEPVNTDGNSVFEIPVLCWDGPMQVTADTTAMSEPHEIEYTLTFDSGSVK